MSNRIRSTYVKKQWLRSVCMYLVCKCGQEVQDFTRVLLNTSNFNINNKVEVQQYWSWSRVKSIYTSLRFSSISGIWNKRILDTLIYSLPTLPPENSTVHLVSELTK